MAILSRPQYVNLWSMTNVPRPCKQSPEWPEWPKCGLDISHCKTTSGVMYAPSRLYIIDEEVLQKLTSISPLQSIILNHHYFFTLRPTWNGCHFADKKFQINSLVQNYYMFESSMEFVPAGQICSQGAICSQGYNKLALVQVMVWCQIGDKP